MLWFSFEDTMKKTEKNSLLNKFNEVEVDLDMLDKRYSISKAKIQNYQVGNEKKSISFLRTLRLLLTFFKIIIQSVNLSFTFIVQSSQRVFSKSINILSKANQKIENNLKENIYSYEKKMALKSTNMDKLSLKSTYAEFEMLPHIFYSAQTQPSGFKNNTTFDLIKTQTILMNVEKTCILLSERVLEKRMDQNIESFNLEIKSSGLNIYYVLTFNLKSFGFKWVQFYSKFINTGLQKSLEEVDGRGTFELLSNLTLGGEKFILTMIAPNPILKVQDNSKKKLADVKNKNISLFESGLQ